jgi:radical SAM superfamily enzyme YgiQ (UPF0313 family)
MKNCRKLGIRVHGTFIIGLPIETQQTIHDDDPLCPGDRSRFSIQVSIAAPYPGTELYRQTTENGWMDGNVMLSGNGIQVSTLRYPHLSADEIEDAVERMYRQFYFRSKPLPLPAEMATIGRCLCAGCAKAENFSVTCVSGSKSPARASKTAATVLAV